jgi:hypothetical protein
MPSCNAQKFSKKRVGRKRLPPLTPGPLLQFVVASHPDEFRTGDTMRNVRSHVMYKHRGQQGFSPLEKDGKRDGDDAPAHATRTPSPMTTSFDNTIHDNGFMAWRAPRAVIAWEESSNNYTSGLYSISPTRSLAARIISATTTPPAGFVPLTSEEASGLPFAANQISNLECLATLQHEYIYTTEFFCHGTCIQARLAAIC